MSKFIEHDIIYFDPPSKYSKLFYGLPKEFYEHYKGEIISNPLGILYVVTILKSGEKKVSFPLDELEDKFFCEKASEYDADVYKYKRSKIYSDIGGIVPAPNPDDYDKALYGNGTWGNDKKGERIRYVNHNVTSFPTERTDGSPLQDEDYVESNEDAEFFIEGVPFKKIGDCAYYDLETGTWSTSAGEVVNSSEVGISSDESISGTLSTQKELNIDLVERISKMKYVHTESIPSLTWTITHNMGTYPNVNVVDANSKRVECEVEYINENSLRCTFDILTSGMAILS